MVNPRHQTPQGQSVAKPGTLLQNILDGNLNMTQRSPKVTCSGRYSDGMLQQQWFGLWLSDGNKPLPSLVLTKISEGLCCYSTTMGPLVSLLGDVAEIFGYMVFKLILLISSSGVTCEIVIT